MSLADRSMSILMTLSDRERRHARVQIFQVDLLNNARTVRPRKIKFGRITLVGEGRISIGSATPVPRRTPILRVPFY